MMKGDVMSDNPFIEVHINESICTGFNIKYNGGPAMSDIRLTELTSAGG